MLPAARWAHPGARIGYTADMFRRLCLPLCLTCVLLACKRTETAPSAHNPVASTAPVAAGPTPPLIASGGVAAAAPTVTPPPPGPAERITTPPGAALSGDSTYAIIAGVLSFAEPGVAGWSAEQRKDLELYQVLRSRGVPTKNMELLLDQTATHANVAAALQRVAGRAPAGSTLLFYYAGHGTRGKDGETYFLAYDSKSSNMPATGIALADVQKTLATHFGGKRAVLMADCCYSGSLKGVADGLADEKKLDTVSLTSADASNLSTSNWTFTQTVIDGLRGDGLMDRDKSGTLSLTELAATVAEEMKYREKQRHGFHLRGGDKETLLSTATPLRTGNGPFRAGSYVLASHEKGTRTAQVRVPGAKESLVRFYHYSHGEERKAKNSELQALKFKRYPKGAELKVYWGNKLWDAKVTEADGDFHFITYPGWPAFWDEWVMSDRIADTGPAGAASASAKNRVEIEWRGEWWPGVILKKQGGRTLVHYDGFGPEWDEWVTDARLRRSAKPKQ